MPQPLTMTIPGKFWDIHLYQGVLYLFRQDQQVQVINWARLIDELDRDPRLSVAIQAAFQQSHLVYRILLTTPALRVDPDIRKLFQSKFRSVAQMHFELDAPRVLRHTLGIFDNPFPFPHADSEIHYGVMIVSADNGVFTASLLGDQITASAWTRSSPEVLWEGPGFGMAAAFQSVALAAGDYGLLQLHLPLRSDRRYRPDLEPVVAADSGFYIGCSWIYASIFGSARGGTGGLMRFAWERDADQQGTYIRRYEGFVPGRDITGIDGYSWAARDKLFVIAHDEIRSLRFQNNRNRRPRVSHPTTAKLPSNGGEVVAAGTAPFGTVIEFDQKLFVLLSDGSKLEMPGRPVRWRLYPRSTFYDNQLHVIYEDSVKIVSFNHDPFLDQRQKAWGARISLPRSQRSRSLD